MASPNNGRVAIRLGAVVASMLALSFAAVPFYNWFCAVTGYGGATSTAAAPEGPALAETVVIRFDANVAPDLPVVFRPMQRRVEVRLGETALAFYEFENLSDAPIASAASFNVTPFSAGVFFDKIDCFCFEQQVLQPGERVEMPVSFFVDPAMLEDREAQGVHTITLSYTMHASELPERRADADAAVRVVEN